MTGEIINEGAHPTFFIVSYIHANAHIQTSYKTLVNKYSGGAGEDPRSFEMLEADLDRGRPGTMSPRG